MRFLFIIFLALVIGYQFGNAQTPCDHTTGRMSRFDAGAFAPGQVTAFDGIHIVTRYYDDQTLTERTYTIDAQTVLPTGFSANYKDQFYWFIYSRCDSYASAIYTPNPAQLKVFKSYLPKK